MSTIYDSDYRDAQQPVMKPEAKEIKPYKESNNSLEIASYQERSVNALKLVDDIVLKQYLTQLSDMSIVPVNKGLENADDLILFKVNKMVYEKDEYATDKFISVVSAMTYTDSSIYLIVDGQKDKTDFYLGIKCNDEKREKSSVERTFQSALVGQFPGIKLDDEFSIVKKGAQRSGQEILLDKLKSANSVSSCVGIPSYKNSKGEYTNANFIQGIEKFAVAMQGKEYTAVILASNTSPQEITNIRKGYENVYTELSAMATQQLAYSTNESLANAMSRTKGYSDSKGFSDTEGTSSSHTIGTSHTDGTSESYSKTKGETRDNKWGTASKVLSAVGTALGVAATATGIGAPVGVALLGVSGAAYLTGLKAGQISESETEQKSVNHSDTTTDSRTTGSSKSHTNTETHTENFSETDGTTSTVGSSKNFTITVQNKHIQEVLKRIDKQLERIEMCESTGLWSTGAYFLSYGTDRATAEIGATIFRSIMQGEQSGVETSAINTWYPENAGYGALTTYVGNLAHPLFNYTNSILGTNMNLLPTSLISSKELAILMGLPRKSVPGLPVVEHISLAKEVVRLGKNTMGSRFKLGCIFDQGEKREENKVWLDAKSMAQHTFVTGSTGCGKSNTIYYLIDQMIQKDCRFLIIEPAKGEYKDVFGNENIYGTNPLKSKLLKVNPFRFPDGVHVLEHIDRLIEIFNVCWPMYAAMPAVLKESILNAYEDCGWDLYDSSNKYSNELFPTFADLQNELVLVINSSAYSEEVKSNYMGSLVTRVKSLNNGICRQIFSGSELGDERLFDENVIVDLSRIGSQETKALIMGILIMRLNEYRSNSGIEPNSPLRHITILEEAHNILKKCSQEQSMEGSNVTGKSVEMISNAIAEMRTYGEGFIIVDQSPNAVDISAIRNTNTKIIMRLPEESDRRIAGKSAAMKDNQIDEIAKLPTGVAVVYQNDWEEPVLCQIEEYTKKPISYKFLDKPTVEEKDDAVTLEILKFLLNGRMVEDVEFDMEMIKEELARTEFSTSNKWIIFEALDEYRSMGTSYLWKDNHFEQLSRLVTDMLAVRQNVVKIVRTTVDFNELSQHLSALIQDKVINLPASFVPVLSQCLMRDYSMGGEVCKKIYNAWFQTMKGVRHE